jgi:hypothetical protein
MMMMIEHPEEKLKEPQQNKKQTQKRFKALVLYSEERGVGK